MQNNTPIPLDIGHNQTGANNRVQLAKPNIGASGHDRYCVYPANDDI